MARTWNRCRRLVLAAVLLASLAVAGAAQSPHVVAPGPVARAEGVEQGGPRAQITNPPIGSPPYAANPAIPYKDPGESSVWSTDRVEIKLVQTHDSRPRTVQPWFAEGVDYEPTPIGGSSAFSPFNDFFFDNEPHTWTGLPGRDIPLLRKLGVNTLRTYGWWKWEPALLNGASNFPNWPALDWATDNSGPDSFSADGGITFAHKTHDTFLDLCWNDGVNPIYVWIGISMRQQDQFNADPTIRENARQFIKYTVQWAAKKYGNHPAVIGFVIGNELNNANTIRSSDFWQFSNDLGALAKASAPTKLTMSAFTDADDVWNTPIVGGSFDGKTSPEVYQLDVWGRNPYNNPSLPGTDLPSYRTQIYDVAVAKMQPSIIRPLLYTEFGTTASTHQFIMGQPYPACWPNVIFPAPMVCPTAPSASPPGSSTGAAVQLGPVSRTGKSYYLPDALSADFPMIGRMTPLPAADTADWLTGFWNVFLMTQAANSALGQPGNLKFASGGYLFEWLDEWWKAGAPAVHDPSPNSANNVFAGGWDDEEWFGLFGVALNGRTCTVQACPLVNDSTGKLIGNPDTLLPRAAVAALFQLYGGAAMPPTATPGPAPVPNPR